MVEYEGDPIVFLRKQRELNAGHLVAPPEPPEFEKAKKYIGSGSYGDVQCIAHHFPSELGFIFRLDKLDEQTLRGFPSLWDSIARRPRTTAQLIRREVALLALNWTQESIDHRQPLLAGATWAMRGRPKYKRGKCIVVFELTCPQMTESGQENAEKFLRKGTFVRITAAGNFRGDPQMPSARVAKWKKHRVHLKFVLVDSIRCLPPEEFFKRCDKMDKVDVFEDKFDLALRTTMKVIDRLKEGFCDHVLEPGPDFEQSELHFENALATIQPKLSSYTGLNEQQTRALYAICTSAHADAPFVLHGPPGTGKTRVIAATVCCLLEMNPDARILLTAPSNMAADMIALKLMETFDASRMTVSGVLRLRSALNDYTSRDQRLDPISYMDTAKKVFKIPEPGTLDNCRVIVCTLACSAHLVKNLKAGHFSHIFVDEAGQATEGDVFLPIGGLVKKQTSLVLCGDDRQLGPVCTLDLSKEITHGFESPLVRYSKLAIYQSDKRLLGRLDTSYRCHPSILSIASEMFYSNELLSGVEGRREPFVEWTGLSKKHFPLMVVSVDGREVWEDNSFGNPKEVEVVIAYIQRLLQDFPHLKPEDIGVISPYRYQTHLLVNALMDTTIPGRKRIAIDSVERFQGSERKVIILTTARTSGLGFLACSKRLNTSVTRAKHLLLVIGNGPNLSRNSLWKRFFDYAMENGGFINWNERKQTDSNVRSAAPPQVSQLKKKKPAIVQRKAGKRTPDPAAKTIEEIWGDGPYIRPSSSSRSSGIPTAALFGQSRNSRRLHPIDDFSPCPVLHQRPFGN